MLRIGNKEVKDLKVGSRQAVAAYLGSELVWQKSTPPSNWDQFDFAGLTSMTPVRRGVTLPNPFDGTTQMSKMRVSMVSDSRIVVCTRHYTSGVTDYVGVYDFEPGHEFDLSHLITTPVSYVSSTAWFGSALPVGLLAFNGDGRVACAYSETGNSGEASLSLSTPFDLTTASVTQSNVNYLGGLPSFSLFSSDGYSSYVHAHNNPSFYQRLLTAPYDIVTKPYAGTTKSANFDTLTGQTSGGITWKGMCFSPDGRYAVSTSGEGLGKAWKFRLTTPWDIETMNFIGMGIMQSQGLYPVSCIINGAGTKMILSNCGQYAQNPGLWEFDLTSLT